MSILDRNYEVTISLKDGKLKKEKNFEIFTTDENIFNIYVALKNADNQLLTRAELADYTIKIHIVRPDLAYKTVTCAINPDGVSDNLSIDLGSDVWSAPGKYKFEFLVEKDNEVLTTSDDSFTIKASLVDGLVEAHSLDFVTLSAMVEENNAIDDVKFDGKTMYFYSGEDCVRKVYLDKSKVPMEELVENEPYSGGKGIKISKNGVISIDTNVIKALVKEVVKEDK